MKRESIKPCIVCGEGVAHDNNLIFYRVRLTRLMINPSAIRRQAGLEMMLGSPALAQVMGPDEDLATEMDEQEALICQDCGRTPLEEISERIANSAPTTPDPEDGG